VEGSEEGVRKAFSFVKEVHDEPPVKVEGDVKAKPDHLPEGV
jgi:hypothetical protein